MNNFIKSFIEVAQSGKIPIPTTSIKKFCCVQPIDRILTEEEKAEYIKSFNTSGYDSEFVTWREL